MLIPLILIAILCAVAFGVLAMLGNWLFGNKLILANESSKTIEAVEIEVAGEILRAEGIEPGKEHSWRLKAGRDTDFKLSGSFAGGEAIEETSLGYTTPGDTLDHTLTVHEDGSVTYQIEGAN